MKNITEIARVIRSKNSGPYELTLDLIIKNSADYQKIKCNKMINEDLISRLYSIKKNEILKIIYFDPARAVKVVIKRRIISGSPGDTDVYGAQQHGPLLGIDLDL